MRPEFVASLRAASSDEEIVALVDEVVSPRARAAPAPPPRRAAAAAAAARGRRAAARKSIVVVSACPTGIAHTYMAADKLVAAGKAAGVDIHVETQGSSGSTPLDPAVIRAADAVIFAVDVGVRDQGRFAGKPLVQSGTKRAINEPDVMIREALAAADDPNAPPRGRHRRRRRRPGRVAAAARSTGSEVRRWLLTGVSYMIPFVAAGGLLIALGFLFGGYQIVNPNPDVEGQSYALSWVLNNSLFDLPDRRRAPRNSGSGSSATSGAVFTVLGQAAFGFLVPALAGYIAYAIADRPGIAPGFVVGAVSVTVGAGFLGGLIGGILAGLVALWISRWKLPDRRARAAAGRDHPAAGHADLQRHHGHGARPPAGRGPDRARRLAQRPERLVRDPARHHPRPDDVLRPRRPGQQGGVPLRHRGAGLADQRLAGDHGHRHGGRHGAAAGDGAEHRRSARSCTPRPSGRTARPPGCSGCPFISEGAIPFAAADPLRVIPSMMLGGATTGAIVAVLRHRGARSARRGVRVLRDQQLPAVAAGDRRSAPSSAASRSPSPRASAAPTPRTPPRTPSTWSTRTPRRAVPSAATA